MNTKYIFVTGGVVSGLGKGITAASLGRLLKNRGYKIRYKKTPREIFKNFIALIITIFIVILICQIPFVKNFLHELYEENFFIKFIVDIFLNIFKMGAN